MTLLEGSGADGVQVDSNGFRLQIGFEGKTERQVIDRCINHRGGKCWLRLTEILEVAGKR